MRSREVRETWETNCIQLSEFNDGLTAKDARLKEQLACLYPHAHSFSYAPSTLPDLSRQEDIVPPVRPTMSRRGNAPTVDAFTA